MYSCWNSVPNERPTFVEIIKNLDYMLNTPTTPTTTPTVIERPSTSAFAPTHNGDEICCMDDKACDVDYDDMDKRER